MSITKNDYGKCSHPYILAYGRRMGSNMSYIQDELANARRRKAPKDAWSCHIEEDIKLARDLPHNTMLRGWLENETGLLIEDQAAK